METPRTEHCWNFNVDEAETWPPPAQADLDDLNSRLETAWRSWRQELAGREP
jgi:hypothetical protein